MSPLTAQVPGAKCDGHKMHEFQSTRLPTELLVNIADQLLNHQDIVAFGLTCKDLYNLLVKKQRRSLEIKFDGAQTTCPTMAPPKYRLLNQQAAILTLPCSLDGLQSALVPRQCSAVSTEMAAANQLFSQNGGTLAKGIKELTLSGYLTYISPPFYTILLHPFISSSGFKSIRPETFKVELGWNDWHLGVLESVSMTNLKILKLPLCLPSDCVRLGQALTTMTKLASLAITDIPDREEFLKELEHLGKGIMSCASTLQELDVEMTNFKHLPVWNRDERFIEQADDGFFIRKLFPCPATEELSALGGRHSRLEADRMSEAPLHLTKLRLKHLSLPWYSFGMIFNAMTIKHLHLPYSNVDDEVWGVLKTYAQLHTLTDIRYDMLSAGFLRFLGQQSLLKELTFARPQDQYVLTNVTFGATFRLSKRAPRLGPDVGVGYPSLDDFFSSLKGMRILKHLVLPPDMYIITRRSLVSMATSLTGLEHLELGFDYDDSELQHVFASYFLCGTSTLKKITFLSLMQPQPLLDFDSVRFQTFLESLGSGVSANLKLLRYMPLNQVHDHPPGTIKTFYHRETPLDSEWWMRLPQNEGEQMFAEGRTPRIVPVGKWDWETARGLTGKVQDSKRKTGFWEAREELVDSNEGLPKFWIMHT